VSRILRTIVLALVIGVAVTAAADASFVTGVDPREGTFHLGSDSLPGGSVHEHLLPPVDHEQVQALPPSPSPPVLSPTAAVVPDATHSPAAAQERPAHKSPANDHFRPSGRHPEGSSPPSSSPPAGTAPAAPVQATATAPSPLADDGSSGPSLALLIGAIATLGAVAILLLRLRPDWFIRGAPPAREQGGPAAG
jgi:hypothetical protein